VNKVGERVTPEKLRAEHSREVVKVRADTSLSWEKERWIREMGLRLNRRLKELEREQ
jgi:hypothetical protein